MPSISEFYGIIIRMFYDEHNPPHFHAQYSGTKGVFDFEGNMLKGNLKPVAQRIIKEWTILRKSELMENWKNIENRVPLNKIAPLD